MKTALTSAFGPDTALARALTYNETDKEGISGLLVRQRCWGG
jgi:hypothetical protein